MKKKILIYSSGGGLGDSIQLFPLILSLQNHFKDSDIFYLGAHDNHYLGKLKEYRVKIPTFETGLKYFGFRIWHYLYAKKTIKKIDIHKFDLIIDLQSKLRNTLILKKIPHKDFYSSTFNFFFCSKKNDYLFHNDINKMTLDNLGKFLGKKVETINYELNQISLKYHQEASRLLPKNHYIGFSITQGNIYRKKNWPIDNFILLAQKLKERNKIPVFFIEKDKIDLIKDIKSKIPEALFPELDSNLSCPALVTALASRLEKTISIDNGVMHMIGLSRTPMIVLFGPTNPDKFAPKIDNIKILDSKKIYSSKDITKITTNDILEFI